jgi:hypothetical protein
MQPPPIYIARWHKALCGGCHKFLGSCISGKTLREFGREHIRCEECRKEITKKVVAIIKQRQQEARKELDGLYELALVVRSESQFPQRALRAIASFHKDGHLPTKRAKAADECNSTRDKEGEEPTDHHAHVARHLLQSVFTTRA